ncbi:helix-turn-helix domain-containing protein [Knoellia sp. LjRoot47]|uniref:helix-turn-helix domain-containing protein n=1 Tax=Knoellia sp. LjRoot47 TaxID=3342330 RepID=UPI003ECDBB4D
MPLNPELEQARHDALTALGGRVRELRLAKSMTQQQLADATGMHRVTINKLEHGQLDVGVSNVTALAAALGAQPQDLFTT